MKNRLKIAVVGVGLAVVSAAGVGTAFASTSAPSTPAAVQALSAAVDTPTAGDTADTPGGADVQQGNQGTPECCTGRAICPVRLAQGMPWRVSVNIVADSMRCQGRLGAGVRQSPSSPSTLAMRNPNAHEQALAAQALQAKGPA